MRPIASVPRPGLVLTTGLVLVASAAFVPAGIDRREIPSASWIVWLGVLSLSLATIYAVKGSLGPTFRDLACLLPPVVLLTLPAAMFAAAELEISVAFALILRALAAASAGLATMTALGRSGLIAALASLRVPARLIAIVHAMLVGLVAIARQVSCMLRARAARRTGRAPWSAMIVAPIETLRGFGRLIGAVLLRSLERAESLERARRARGGGEV